MIDNKDLRIKFIYDNKDLGMSPKGQDVGMSYSQNDNSPKRTESMHHFTQKYSRHHIYMFKESV
jgi:hypothetical protein